MTAKIVTSEIPFYAVPLLYVCLQFLVVRRAAKQNPGIKNLVGICKVAIGAGEGGVGVGEDNGQTTIKNL